MFHIESDSTQPKAEFYQSLAEQLRALLAGERDLICNAAQFSAFIMQTLPQLNWAGFYFARGEELILGPYVGKVACTRIPFSRGVCGKAARTGLTQRVDDVHAVPDHIACDAASNAELVVPVITAKRVVAVFDIDSPSKHRFDQEDQHGIEQLVSIWQEATDFSWQI
ncbi:GAF domain-containing protein [Maribrevibacterium harenarium]|uniref:GAF domain-containing protein n=1 Tax=Maribrevibacterium harenarium TaxID=2589817 RepID=A0A501WTN6_9GAMM|nr:GAF domain-containing protein [Maribrevibacterium harenarium]TPE49196.1 GAF domain-containing protein [Maribrevibacterium harenarium]